MGLIVILFCIHVMLLFVKVFIFIKNVSYVFNFYHNFVTIRKQSSKKLVNNYFEKIHHYSKIAHCILQTNLPPNPALSISSKFLANLPNP